MIQPGLLEMFYLRASAKAWAGGAEKTTIAELPESKVITTEEGPLRYKDVYYTYPGSEESSGHTGIWVYDDTRGRWLLAWIMHYGGHYPEGVIPFLKAVLRQAYEAKEFMGGRGSEYSRSGNLRYRNYVEKNDFRDFKGEEEIREVEHGVQLGFHWYRGHLLIPTA